MKQLVTKLICTIFLVSLIQVAPGAEYQVRADEVASVLKKAQAGDRIVIQKGSYRDLELKWIGHGTEAAPIRIEAEEAGGYESVVLRRCVLPASGSRLPDSILRMAMRRRVESWSFDVAKRWLTIAV